MPFSYQIKYMDKPLIQIVKLCKNAQKPISKTQYRLFLSCFKISFSFKHIIENNCAFLVFNALNNFYLFIYSLVIPHID